MQAGIGNAQMMAGTAIFASILLSPLPQLLGLAFGISEKELGLNLNLTSSERLQKKLQRAA